MGRLMFRTTREVDNPSLTAGRLREIFDYDASTGQFSRKSITGPNAKIGPVANKRDPQGYLRLKVDGKVYAAHRLAWLYVHGSWPDGEIDHANRVRDDNRIQNLRSATKGQNAANGSRAPGVSGLRGVSPYRGKWKAQINANGVKRYLGLHASKEEAYRAYCAAAEQYFGEFSAVRHGA